MHGLLAQARRSLPIAEFAKYGPILPVIGLPAIWPAACLASLVPAGLVPSPGAIAPRVRVASPPKIALVVANVVFLLIWAALHSLRSVPPKPVWAAQAAAASRAAIVLPVTLPSAPGPRYSPAAASRW
ncbi:hypothetical protein [Bordetella sp. FB-8]|uniref:hypothetical protein n=1 Tax=Bordetella sp. FB-8 TaxID=1159870 RepID=UPI00037FC2CA|nr:hypothetical protein [Bordetella sp. FB-8]